MSHGGDLRTKVRLRGGDDRSRRVRGVVQWVPVAEATDVLFLSNQFGLHVPQGLSLSAGR
jgi:hypothetical protein